ncbi:MAG: calcium/sodium antiporter [bacterium]
MQQYIIDGVLLVVSIALITKGADWFTESAVGIAEATRIPRVVIGATIVSMATTLPELSVSTMATIMGTDYVDVAVGNAVGSTICNIGLILASCLLIRPMAIKRRLSLEQGLFMILSGATVALLSAGGRISRWGGGVFFSILALYLIYSVRTAQGERQRAILELEVKELEELKGVKAQSLKREILWFLIGAACVVGGSRILIHSGVRVAEALGVSRLVISLTLVAIGTSLPEYVTAITATIKGYQELSVGNIMGANILDIVWVLGVSALIRPLGIQRQTLVLDLPVMMLIMILLVAFARTKDELSRWEGGVMLAIYIAYVAILFGGLPFPKI